MSRRPKKYHYIYKTTCQITGKFYVGMHSSDSLDDGYLGSGKILGYSRKKYGDENHVRDILEFCSSRDELKQREKEIVCEALLADPLNINLRYGGEGGGGWSHLTPNQQRAFSRAGALSSKRDTRAIALKSAATSKSRGTMYPWSKESQLAARKQAASPEANARRKATMLERGHMKGEKNHNFGIKRIGINKDGILKRVLPEQLQEFLDSGWTKGFRLQ